MTPRADLIIDGRVATLAGDSGFGWQAGLAVAGDRVVATGKAEELDVFAGPRTVRWRLRDDLVALPGIVDAHLHLMSLTLAESHIDLTGTDLVAALDLVREGDRRLREGSDESGWLLGHGWTIDDFGQWPDAEMLEKAAPGRPVALYAHDHHSRWVSTAALRLAAIDSATLDPAGGMVRRERGSPTGILHETASALVDWAIPDPSAAEIEEALARVSERLLALGITGCHDPGELGSDTTISRGPLLYRELAERDGLALHVHASIRAPQLERAIALGLRSGQSVGRYRMGWLKLFADGSLGSRSAALLEPYTDAESRSPTGGPTGMFLTEREELADLVRRAEGAGIRAQVHAIGDAAVRMALDVFEALDPHAAPDIPLMRRIEHAQLVDPADISRFGRLNIAASVQPVHLRSDAEAARIAWGARVENAFPLAGLVESGALIPFGTDAPVEPPDPWPGIAVAVVRRDPFDPAAQPLAPQQAIDLPRALRAASLDPALGSGQSDVGRLVAGQLANLVVVPTAALDETSDSHLLASTRPLATVLDGQVAYRGDAFDP